MSNIRSHAAGATTEPAFPRAFLRGRAEWIVLRNQAMESRFVNARRQPTRFMDIAYGLRQAQG